jgi:hypothetical protein
MNARDIAHGAEPFGAFRASDERQEGSVSQKQNDEGDSQHSRRRRGQ